VVKNFKRNRWPLPFLNNLFDPPWRSTQEKVAAMSMAATLVSEEHKTKDLINNEQSTDQLPNSNRQFRQPC